MCTTASETTQTLSPEEIADPWLVIKDLFFFCDLPDWRQLLWTSFKANITGTYHKHLTCSERSDVVYLHEYMQRLVEAVWLLHRQQQPDAETR